MAFPADPLDVGVDLWLNGAWVDVTAYTLIRDRITITRGKADQAARVDPSRCRLSLDNRDGRFTPANPVGPYYGQLTRNVPIRVRVGDDVRFTGEVSAWPQQWDVAGVDVFTPLEAAGILRRLGQGTVSGTLSAPRRWIPTTDPVAYWPLTDPDGSTEAAAIVGSSPLQPRVGTATEAEFAAVPVEQGWGRATLAPWLEPVVERRAVDDGIYDQSILWGVLPSLAWGGTLTLDFMLRGKPADTRLLNVAIYDYGTVAGSQYIGRVGFHGILAQLSATSSTVSLNGAATGVFSLPQAYDDQPHHFRMTLTQTGADVITNIYLDGVNVINDTRTYTLDIPFAISIGDNENVTGVKSRANIVGHVALYYDDPPPLADAVDAAFGHRGETAGRRIERLCVEESIPFGSLDNLDDTALVGPQRSAGVVELLTAAAEVDGGVLYEPRVVTHTLDAFAADGLQGWLPSGAVVPTLAESTTHVHSGESAVRVTWPTGTSGVARLLPSTMTVVGFTYTVSVWVYVPSGAPALILVIGDDVVTVAVGAQSTTVDAWERITVEFVATTTDHVLYVTSHSAFTAGQQAWIDDGSIATDRVGLGYRTRAGRVAEPVTCTVEYAGELSPPLSVTEDDSDTQNDVTVTRRGSEVDARVVLETGALSVRVPPDGVGRYDSRVTLDLASDLQSADQASWRVHHGTWDEPRYPSVHLDLGAVPQLIPTASALDVASRLVITGPPAWLPPDDIDLAVAGYSEVLDAYGWDLVFNCTPFGPWRVGVTADDAASVDAEDARADTDGSVLAVAVSSGTTALSIATTTTGPRWVTDAAELPVAVNIGGERVELTTITDSTWSYVGTAVASTADNASVTPAMASGWAAGDLLCVLAACRNSGTGEPVTPTGWVDLYRFANVALFGRIAETGDTGPLCAFTNGAAGVSTGARMFAFRADLYDATNLHIQSVGRLNGSSTSIGIPPIFVNESGVLLLSIAWIQSATASQSGYPGTAFGSTSVSAGNDMAFGMSYTIGGSTIQAPFGSVSTTGSVSAISRGMRVALRVDRQSATATRSTNGIVKSHAAGAAVSLWRPVFPDIE